MNTLIAPQVIEYLKDSGLGELLSTLLLIATMALGWKIIDWIRRL